MRESSAESAKSRTLSPRPCSGDLDSQDLGQPSSLHASDIECIILGILRKSEEQLTLSRALDSPDARRKSQRKNRRDDALWGLLEEPRPVVLGCGGFATSSITSPTGARVIHWARVKTAGWRPIVGRLLIVDVEGWRSRSHSSPRQCLMLRPSARQKPPALDPQRAQRTQLRWRLWLAADRGHNRRLWPTA